ncbi:MULTISPECIES: iron-siderophore ABC transporter substrate-binding protein [Prauserella salsuginis group]|uniref:Iron complex transport system substrate-binding protein n=2 Tax=Prauserella salsuginis group TaxID=2893672 RepID=A0A839XLI5_9PSEU|nr:MULTISPECIES: iron-siderophore ABC transporter substrate-binding protein [Prauserella salsuginis group]MBB3661603.1 iron complex transport system substrate-binding protein [Prauserella sediminis]MCR3719519.1 iron complex transport system substrate-binding protein [Prauserella flava]MCR3735467.1 iron complex transport system substrate-binding protein [Prauserella salsuginis]
MSRAARPLRTLFAVFLAGVLVALTGCTTTGADGRADGGEGQLNPEADDSQFPVTIPTKFGDVTIDEPPQRVVALGWTDAEVAMALGVQPVGTADWLEVGDDGLGPWSQQEYDRPPAKLGTLEVNMEQVAGLNPDLILDTRSSGERARHDRLTEIGVPVVSLPEGADDYLTTWQQQLDMIGKALGRQDEAEQLRKDLNAKFDRVAGEHPEFKGTEMVLASRLPDEWGAYLDGDGRVEFMQRLGFVNSPRIERQPGGRGFSVPISDERLDLLDADLTAVFLIGADPEDVTGDPLYRAIPSVEKGNDLVLSDQDISLAFSSNSVVGLSWALDEVVPLLADTLG